MVFRKINRKGQSNIGFLFVIIIFTMFFFAITSLISITGWNQITNTIDSIPNETIQPNVKAKISGMTFLSDWADKLFVMSFVIMLLLYLGVASLSGTENGILVFLLLGLVVLVTVVSMFLSNAWTWLIGQSTFSTAAASLGTTGFFMKYFPLITFFLGFAGLVIFYSRKKVSFNNSGGSLSDFE